MLEKVCKSGFMLFLLAALMIACKNPIGGPPPKEEKPPDFTPNLPSVPTIQIPNVPINMPDGSYSIFGLRKKKSETMRQRVRVTGIVVEKGKVTVSIDMPATNQFSNNIKQEVLEKIEPLWDVNEVEVRFSD